MNSLILKIIQVKKQFLQFINDTLPNLKSLGLRSYTDDIFDRQDKVRLENLKKFSIDFIFSHDMPIHFPVTSDNIKTIDLSFSRSGKFLANWIPFIVQNKSLKKLIIGRYSPSFLELLKVIDALSELREIVAL